MSETWLMQPPPEVKDLEAWRKTLPDSLADAPGRREALLMVLEHRMTGRLGWYAGIEREPTTKLLPWVDMPEMQKFEGRLAGLAPGFI